jgi:hypothetical protein
LLILQDSERGSKKFWLLSNISFMENCPIITLVITKLNQQYQSWNKFHGNVVIFCHIVLPSRCNLCLV